MPRQRRRPAPPTYTGGATYVSKSGYIWEKVPGHPASNVHGYVLQHRLVVEKALGRYLSGSEVVHHVNHDRQDNRPENLRAMDRTSHGMEHGRPVLALDEREVRKALLGRSTAEAASLLGVHHMTLRNRFPKLLAKRHPPGFLDAHEKEIRSLSRNLPLESIADRFETTRQAVAAALARWRERDGRSDEPARQPVFLKRRGRPPGRRA